MCGLIGGAGDLGPKAHKMIQTLLELDIIRGDDSTGVMIKSDKGCSIHKELGVPWTGLYKNKAFGKAISEPSITVVLGHNRAATKGEVNRKNAHPFKHDHIHGAHNGTLYNTTGLDNHEKFDVDSDNIFHHMSNNGVTETINKLAGAFTLTWYDETSNTINFVRNDKRPLFICYSSDKTMLFWASESWMLHRAAKKAKLPIGDIHSLPELCHYKIEIPDKSGTFQERKFGKIRIKKLLGHTYQTGQRTYHGGTGNWGGNGDRQFARYQRLNPPHKPKSNVINIADIHRKLDDLKTGEVVTFVIDRAVENVRGVPYLEGHVWIVGAKVRIYPPRKDPRWDELNVTQRQMTGKIKKVKNGYATISLGTVRELVADVEVPEEEKEARVYRVHESDYVNEARFRELLKPGCGVCNDPLDLSDEPDLKWWHDSPICGHCDIDDVIFNF